MFLYIKSIRSEQFAGEKKHSTIAYDLMVETKIQILNISRKINFKCI